MSGQHELLPAFRFHPSAYDDGAFERVDGTCSACGRERPLRYTGSFYARELPAFLCPWCVADGTAAREFRGEFSDHLGIEGVSSDPDEPIVVDEAESVEVARRTPSYVSWQQEEWRSHCGRPCAYLRGVGADDLPEFLDEPAFAADVDGGLGWDGALLRQHLEAGGSLGGHLFRCLECGAHRLHVDAA